MPAAPAHRYRPEIDGLRACAVLSVMIYHLQNSWLPGGFVGVDVFFVISGYVVTGSLAESRARSVFGFIGAFYARRLARILPALVVMLVATALLSTLFIPPSWLSQLNEITLVRAFFGLSNLVLMQNGEVYFTPRAELNPATHTWSLGVEEQYYLIAPLLIYLTLRGRTLVGMQLRGLAIAGLALLTLASLGACIWASRDHARAEFYFVAFRFWELGAGALLFLAPPRRNLGMLASGVGAICIGLAFWLADPGAFPWPWALLPVLGTALIIRYPGGAVARVLSAAPALWIGRRSYSLYLWHWPVYVLLRWAAGLQTWPMFTVALVASVALAALSYR
jgi:peptidoglycan/LPS O-acetylase OafA/YrhL